MSYMAETGPAWPPSRCGPILTASLGAGRVSGQRMTVVIFGEDQRPSEEDVSRPGRGVNVNSSERAVVPAAGTGDGLARRRCELAAPPGKAEQITPGM